MIGIPSISKEEIKFSKLTNSFGKALEELTQVVHELEDKINPILTPDCPVCKDDTQKEPTPPESAFEHFIRYSVHHMDVLATKVKAIIERVTV